MPGIQNFEDQVARFRHLVDGHQDLYWVWDAKRVVTYVNEAAANFFGVTTEALKVMGVDPYIHPDDYREAMDSFRMGAHNGKLFEFHARLCRHDGQFKDFLIRGTPYVQGGELKGVLASAVETVEGTLHPSRTCLLSTPQSGVRSKTVSFDVDGVLANMYDGVLALGDTGMRGAVGEDTLRSDPSQWRFLRAGRYDALVESVLMRPYFWLSLEPFADTAEAAPLLDEFMACGDVVGYFFASRPSSRNVEFGPGSADSRFGSAAWLRKIGLNHYTAVLADVPPARKVATLKMLCVDVHLEDIPEDFQLIESAGIDCWLIDRPWNRSFQTTKRVKSLSEFIARGVFRVSEEDIPKAG